MVTCRMASMRHIHVFCDHSWHPAVVGNQIEGAVMFSITNACIGYKFGPIFFCKDESEVAKLVMVRLRIDKQEAGRTQQARQHLEER
eukprot:g39008.t1